VAKILKRIVLKILIVSQYFWPENFRINDLAVELVNRGHCVTVLTGLPNYPQGKIFDEYLSNKTHFAVFKGVDIIRVPLIPRGSSSIGLFLNYFSFTILACVLGPWKLRGRVFDVVFTCQLSPVTVGIPAALISFIKRAPMAMWVLDLWPDTLAALGVVKSPRILSIVSMLVSFIYRRCDLILAQSRRFIPKIRALSRPNTPIAYFPSWAEVIFKSGGDRRAPEVLSKPNCFNLMFAGNIGESQDFQCIIAAANILKAEKQIRWLIVGDGRMFTWLQEQVQSKGLLESVILLGRYPVERMPEMFAHADAMLVSLANREVFSMTIPGKLQSYLAAAMPIIGSINGEAAEVIQQARAGFTCRAGTPVDLAAIVLRMSSLSPADRGALGQNGFRFSEQNFNRIRLIEKLEKMLFQLCKNKQNPV
jgi:colanic acid biosynthesis glycosyl transferase WcaI